MGYLSSEARGSIPLSDEGSNGVLTLTQILVVVNEVQLKPADGSCDNVTTTDTSDDCPEFEAPPRFLDLPLDGTPVAAVTSLIAAVIWLFIYLALENRWITLGAA